MATVTAARTAAMPGVTELGVRFDWLVVGASAWLGAGLYWDGWAHGYGLPDSFWTIWHAAFYSGFAACAAVILGGVARNRPTAATWRDAIPAGYQWAVLGVFVFGVAGVFDMIWHTIFGIELSTDALLSPSHLALGTGAALMVSGPFVAGAVGDLLLWRLRPSDARPLQLHVFAFALPAAYLAIYLAVVVLRVGSGWTVHELTGMVTLCGIVGLLISLVAAPRSAIR